MPAPTLQGVKDLNGGITIREDATLGEAEQSRQKLIAFCATGNATELVDKLKQAKLPLFGPIEKSLVQWRTGGPRSQEYFQAATQVLANPNAYAVQFDTWLSKDLDRQLVDRYGLSRNQSIYVRDAIYNNFVTSNNNHAFHVMERCANFAVCPSSTILSDAETAQAQRVAQQVRQAIDQQRWDLLIPLQ